MNRLILVFPLTFSPLSRLWKQEDDTHEARSARACDSLDEFLAELTEPLFRFLVRMTRDRDLAADLTQETLLRAWRKRHALRKEQSRRVWVFRIAANLYRDHRRRAAPVTRENIEWEHHPGGELSPDECASHLETQERVVKALDELPQRQREVMYLRVVEELLPREIAEILDIEAGVVRSNLSAARKRLRSLLPELLPPSSRGGSGISVESETGRGAGEKR